MSQNLNEQPFEYTSKWGTKFYASRADFACGVAFCDVDRNSTERLITDMAEMIEYHRKTVYPGLDIRQFPGYAHAKYTENPEL